MKYISFLRGINVGKFNKIPMLELKKLYSELGYHDVQSYINSGNLIFNADGRVDLIEIQKTIEQAIEHHFALQIDVAVLTAENYMTQMSNAPAWWGEDPNTMYNAVFVIAPITSDEVFQEIDLSKEYEQIAVLENVLFWSVPVKDFSRIRLSKIVSKKVYTKITIRNINTCRKIEEIISK